MSGQIITWAEVGVEYGPDGRYSYHRGDAEKIAKAQARLAKLKPRCMRCGKVLPKRELGSRVCSDRSACTVRVICSFWGRTNTRLVNGVWRKVAA